MENNELKSQYVLYPYEATRQLLMANFSTSSNEATTVPVLVIQQSKCFQQKTIPGICSSLCFLSSFPPQADGNWYHIFIISHITRRDPHVCVTGFDYMSICLCLSSPLNRAGGARAKEDHEIWTRVSLWRWTTTATNTDKQHKKQPCPLVSALDANTFCTLLCLTAMKHSFKGVCVTAGVGWSPQSAIQLANWRSYLHCVFVPGVEELPSYSL